MHHSHRKTFPLVGWMLHNARSLWLLAPRNLRRICGCYDYLVRTSDIALAQLEPVNGSLHLSLYANGDYPWASLA